MQPHDEGSDRVVLVIYQPRIKNLKRADRARLEALGFEPDQGPLQEEEYLLKLVKKKKVL